MEGRSNKQLNTDNRRARAELTNRVEGRAQEILDHIASNPQPDTSHIVGEVAREKQLIALALSWSFLSETESPNQVLSSYPRRDELTQDS